MPDATSADRIETIRGVQSLDALYVEADRINITPGWIPRQKAVLQKEPTSAFPPCHWRYDECRAALDSAGRLIDTRLAERRNLVMRAPVEGNDFATTRTMVAAYQLILPGEKARSHRHAPHALRVIIDSRGAYSTVDGEKTPMETGDVVLTPGWSWHEHGHDGDEPAAWFDGLDVPLNHLLEPMFFEEHPHEFEPNVRVVSSSPYRFPSDDIKRALDRAAPDPEGAHGRRIHLPAPSMPTMDLRVQRLDGGFVTRRQRTTSNHVFSVMEGGGVTEAGDRRIEWRRGDTISVPCWTWFSHRATSDAVLFSMTDEPLMRFARYHRAELA